MLYQEPPRISASRMALSIILRGTFWLAVSGLFLGSVYSLTFSDPSRIFVRAELGGIVVFGLLGLAGGIVIGLATGLVLSLVLLRSRIPAQGRTAYRLRMYAVGIVASVLVGAMLHKMQIDLLDPANVDVIWRPERGIPSTIYFHAVLLPIILIGLGGWFATVRVVAWYVGARQRASEM